MRFRSKLLITWVTLALLICVGSFWPIRSTIMASFDRVTSAAFAGTKRSLQSLRAAQVSRMEQAGGLVIRIPELRALIVDNSTELTPANRDSLQERLDSLAGLLSVTSVCVLDSSGRVLAQNRDSAWASVPDLEHYLGATTEARQLRARLFGADGIAPRSQDGLWNVDGKLYQVEGIPLTFGAAATDVQGAMILAAPLTDAMAAELARSHNCAVSFFTTRGVVASSLVGDDRADLGAALGPSPDVRLPDRDIRIGGQSYRSSFEPLIDQVSGIAVGGIAIAASRQNAQAALEAVWRDLLTIFTCGMTIAAGASYVLSAAVTRPVSALVTGVRQVAGGDLSVAIPGTSRDEIGELAGAFNDMVERLRSQRQLQQQVEESRAASRAKSQFLANMSHEIRTPLNGVIGVTELLAGTALDSRQKRYVGLVKSSAEILTALISDVLDFSKIEAGKLELESIEFDTHATVQSVVNLLAQKAYARGLELACDIGPGVPRQVRGDPNRIRQILMNLLSNALKFTERGYVIVRLSASAAGPERTAIRVEVIDTGIGIPADRMDRLFQSFSQVDASTTRKYGGTGLGLAICRQLAELMGGQVGVQSQVGRGSVFWFSIVVQAVGEPDETGAPLVNATPSAADRRQPMIVVGPHAQLRAILCRQLDALGEHTVAAEDGGEALTLAISEAEAGAVPRAIVIDQSMPDMGLTEWLGALESRHSLARVPVIVLAAPGQCGPSGLVEGRLMLWVEKPFDPSRLSEALDALAEPMPPFAATSPLVTPQDTAAPTNSRVRLPAPTVTRPGPSRILLAEDNEINQVVASELLTAHGYTCHVVGDGHSAVDAALSGNFDLVLMDCQMPGLDGLSATRKIREQQGKERIGDERASWPIPIVGLTAHASGSDRNRCLEAGMDAYCGKPFEPAQLLATIDLLLSPPSSAADDAVGSENRRHSDKPASAPAAPPAPADRPTIPPESSKPIQIDGLIQRCSGNRTLAATILRKFEKQSAELFAELRRHADASDAAELARVSHALKGSAGIVAAGDVARWAAELERAGRGGDLGGVTADLERLQQAIARCIDYCGREATRLQAESADREPEGTHATAHRG